MVKKEFYRKNLPHLQIQGQTFFVTWLLAGIVSNKALVEIKQDFDHTKTILKKKPDIEKAELTAAHFKYLQHFDEELNNLEAGRHYLKIPEIAKIVAGSIHYWDKKRLDLFSYCIMSNHVHAVFAVFENDEKGNSLYLQDVMQSIKNFSARECNKILNSTGQFWHHESYDRLIRDREELYRIICYVLDNPVKAGLCKERKDWKWSYIKPEYGEFM